MKKAALRAAFFIAKTFSKTRRNKSRIYNQTTN
jgi:hypothetical protein